MGDATTRSWLRRLTIIAVLGAAAVGGLPHHASAAPRQSAPGAGGSTLNWLARGAASRPTFNPQPDPPGGRHGATRVWLGSGPSSRPTFNPQPDPPGGGRGRSILRPFVAGGH